MIADNTPWKRPDDINAFSRLDSLILRQANPEAWKQAVQAEAVATMQEVDVAFGQDREGLRSDERVIKALVRAYRLAHAVECAEGRREYFFWAVLTWVHLEAHVGPDALLHQDGYLGPLWKRLDAIQKKYGWPEEDDEGEVWEPDEHVNPLPDDYIAWTEEFNQQADAMEKAAFRAVCRKYGVEEIAHLKENDLAEYDRRCRIGQEHARSGEPDAPAD
jgi:hypothetical protein